jgi:DNA-binding NarL/FixJ family response regulator
VSSNKGANTFDDRAVARALEAFQTTLPPEVPPDEGGPLHVLMHAGTARTVQQLRSLLEPEATIDWDDRATGGSIDSLLALACGVPNARARVVALIDARWVTDDQLERWHRAYPLLPVVLVAREEGISTLRAMVACFARGCVTPKSSLDQLAQALDTVSRGGLWIAAAIVPYLYACMLAHSSSIREDGSSDASAAQTPATTGTADAPRPPAPNTIDLLAVAALTRRELAAIELARTGYTNKEIAKSLGISGNTVKKHLSNAFDKLGIHRRRQLY